MTIIARHLSIHGRVQGVFYGNWTKDSATSLGLAGWVRNRLDGSVEAWVEGRKEAVEQFIALAHQGPPAAKVVRMDVEDRSPQGLVSFHKHPTA